MELLVKLMQQCEPRTRDYTDAAGVQKQFKSLGLVLRSGFDTLYCEAVQDYVDFILQNPLDPKALYKADLVAQARSFVDAKGVERWQSELRLSRIYRL